jgi:hypothetical protein
MCLRTSASRAGTVVESAPGGNRCPVDSGCIQRPSSVLDAREHDPVGGGPETRPSRGPESQPTAPGQRKAPRTPGATPRDRSTPRARVGWVCREAHERSADRRARSRQPFGG